MALVREYETGFGVTLATAYCRIADARIEIAKDASENTVATLHFLVLIYADEAARTADLPHLESFTSTVGLDLRNSKNQHNLLKQAYDSLKTEEGWTDAVDA